ncbi:hypothetical protein QBC39DRAFT_370039 [Podospora conica]|nr:hypothetical protein QBC39DRAFT_370039 [Schizothecium conicum]
MATSRTKKGGKPKAAPNPQSTDEARRVEEVFHRPPPTPERVEELAAAAREFYEIAMKEKHEKEKRQFLVSAVLVALLGVAWYVLTPRS